MSNQHRRVPEDPAASPSGFDLSQVTYQSLVNALPLSLLVKDLEGRRVFANQAYLDRRGKTLDDVIGKRDEDLFPAEIARRYHEDDRRVIDSGESLHDVEETVDAEGKTRWIERVKSPIFGSQNQIVGVQLIFWDVTDRVAGERDLQHERRLLSTLMQNIPDCIYFKDTESRFLRVSEAMAKKFGLGTPEDVIGKTDADVFTDEHATAAREDELRIMQTAQTRCRSGGARNVAGP